MNTPTPAPVNHAAPYRGPIEAVRICLRKYVDFDGRASRSELWWFALFILLCEVAMRVLRQALWGDDWRSYMPPWLIEFIVFTVFVTPATAVGARRLHDTGRNDWWLLLFFLPAAVLISTLVLRFRPSVYFWSGNDAISVAGGPYVADGLASEVAMLLWFSAVVHAGWIIAVLFLPSILIIAFLRPTSFWVLVAIYIPLASIAYRLVKTNATQSGFYFDGLQKFEKYFILLVLALPVLYGISRMDPVLDMLMPTLEEIELFYPILFFTPAGVTTVAIFTYWWVQQGNPAQNKYDQTKTLRIKKWLVAGLPAAVVINHAFLIFHFLFVRN